MSETSSADRTQPALKLWRHIFAGERGLLAIWSGERGPDGEIDADTANTTYHFYPQHAYKAAECALAESERGREAYFCAHLLTQRRRIKENASTVRTLWGDLDGGNIPNGRLEPSAVVESSPGHYHPYWRLTDSIPPEIAEQLNMRLAHQIGADPSGFDLTQILRVPGTVNYKYPERPTVRVRYIRARRAYSPAELEELLGGLDDPPRSGEGESAADEPPVVLKGRDLEVWHGKRPKYGDGGEIDRSATLYKISGVLYGAGATRRVIVEALAERDQALGYEKYSSNRDGGAREYERIFEKLVKEERPAPEPAAPSGGGRMAAIVVNDRQLRDVGDEAMAALEARNAPRTLFARAGKIIRLGQDENGAPIIQEASEPVMRYHLARAANFVHRRERRDSTEETQVHPPRDVVQDVLSFPHLPFPPLIGVPRTPFFRPDGTIVTEPGYDAETRLYYVPAHEGFMVEVPEKPSGDEVAAAVALLDEAAGDFPYVDKAAAANTIALLLTPILRNIIPGPVPLALIDKPAPGTGGSLLAEVVSLLATGSPAGMMSAPRDDEEVRKQITSALLRGNLVVTMDNVDGVLNAPSLSRALTSEFWEDRILGRSEMIRVPQRATWIASGNNLQVGGDLPRRGYWIRLDAGMERPWERSGFRHPNLKPWVAENRARLVSALLTLGCAWFAEGKPVSDGAPTIGGYEGWSHTVGGVLEVAGVEEGFLGNLGEMYERAADGTRDWTAFLEVWKETYGGAALTTKQIAAHLHGQDHSQLRDALPEEFGGVDPDHPEKGLSRKLGKAFAKREGRRHGERGLHLERVGEKDRAVKWAVRTSPDGSSERLSLMSLMSFPPPTPGAPTRAHAGAGGGGPKQTQETQETQATNRPPPDVVEEF